MKAKKVFFNYVVRYFLGFLTVFCCSLLVAQTATKSIESDVLERSELKMEQGVKGIRDIFSKMDLIDQILSRNSAFAVLVSQSGAISQNKVISLRDANRFFTEIGFTADDIPYMFVLFADNDLYLSSSQCSFHFSGYYPKFLSLRGNADLSDAAPLKAYLFHQYQNKNYHLPLTSACFWRANKERSLDAPLLYLPQHGFGGRPAYLSCFLLDRLFIIRQILPAELENHTYLRIADARTGALLLEHTPAASKPKSEFPFKAATSAYHIIEKDLAEEGWKITLALPRSFIAAQLRPVRRLLSLYLFAGMALVILLTLYFSLNRYRKVRRLLFSLPAAGSEASKKRGFDEYYFLLSQIIDLQNQGKHYRLSAEQLIRQNESILLEHLIVSGIQTPAERRVFEKCFQTAPEFFCVVIVRIADKNVLSYEQLSLHMVSFLQSRYTEKFANVYSGVNDELFLLEINSGQEANTQKIHELFRELILHLAGKYDAVFHVGISAIGTDIANIHKCYEQAKQMVEAQYPYAHENRIKLYDISYNSSFKNPANPDFLNHLYNYLLCGQAEQAAQSFSQLEHYCIKMPYLFEIQKQQLYYSIRNIFFSAWLSLNCDLPFEQILPDFDDRLPFPAIWESFRQAAEHLAEFIRQNKKSQNHDLRNKILAYLQEHYRNPLLSAALVSQAMGISEKYLFQFLKEQTGETFAAYLLNLRIEQAKQYLKDPALSNEKIAELTGFGSVNTFYRNFKAQTGVSPKLYQEGVCPDSDNLRVCD